MKTKEENLKWKLSERPSTDNLSKLVSLGIITKDEARKIILEETNIKQDDIDELKNEIKILRELVLSYKPNPNIIERYMQNYPKWNWNTPNGGLQYYQVYCSANTLTSLGVNGETGTTVLGQTISNKANIN